MKGKPAAPKPKHKGWKAKAKSKAKAKAKDKAKQKGHGHECKSGECKHSGDGEGGHGEGEGGEGCGCTDETEDEDDLKELTMEEEEIRIEKESKEQPRPMLNDQLRKALSKQGYRLLGTHSGLYYRVVRFFLVPASLIGQLTVSHERRCEAVSLDQGDASWSRRMLQAHMLRSAWHLHVHLFCGARRSCVFLS